MPIRRLLVANRSEIAIRFSGPRREHGIRTIAIYAEEDKLSLHRFKADEAYLIGRGPHLAKRWAPLEAYLSIPEVIRVAKEAGADPSIPAMASSRKPGIRRGLRGGGITFIGPSPETLRALGNKVDARNLAASVSVPVMPGDAAFAADDADEVKRLAAEIGYP